MEHISQAPDWRVIGPVRATMSSNNVNNIGGKERHRNGKLARASPQLSARRLNAGLPQYSSLPCDISGQASKTENKHDSRDVQHGRKSWSRLIRSSPQVSALHFPLTSGAERGNCKSRAGHETPLPTAMSFHAAYSTKRGETGPFQASRIELEVLARRFGAQGGCQLGRCPALTTVLW